MAIEISQGVYNALERCASDIQVEMAKAAHTVLNEGNNDKIPTGWYDDAIAGEINQNMTQNKPKYNSDDVSFDIELSIPVDERKQHIEAMMEVLDDGN